jgi:hypothetical protein
MSTTPLQEGLAALRAHYAKRIDAAVAAGRMDLVRELADGYEDEALQLLLTVEGGVPTESAHGAAEILEFGPVRPHRSGWATRQFGFWRHRKR